MQQIIPTKDYVILEFKKEESRIALPDDTDTSKLKGDFIVTEIGKDCKEIQIGDKVIPSKHGIFTTKINDKDMYFTKEELISIIIREEK